MTTRTEIGERLKAERERVNLTQGELARTAGVSKTTQANYEAGMRSPDAEYLLAVAGGGIDIQFVVTGQRLAAVAEDDVAIVPRVDVFAAAGHGAANRSDEHELQRFPVSRAWLTTHGLFARNLRVIEIRGDSMHGVLSDGDLVLVDQSDTAPRSGFVYVIRQGEELLVKYCQVLPDGTLRVRSENANFGAYDVDLNKAPNVAIIGRVVASMHKW